MISNLRCGHHARPYELGTQWWLELRADGEDGPSVEREVGRRRAVPCVVDGVGRVANDVALQVAINVAASPLRRLHALAGETNHVYTARTIIQTLVCDDVPVDGDTGLRLDARGR